MQHGSYVHGASDRPLLGETISENFENTVARWPDSEALVVRHQGIRWSYHELQERVNAWAAGFVALGLEPGDRIGIWSHNNWEWLVTQLASAKAGLILVNINPAYRRTELVYVLNRVGVKCLITMPEFKTSDYLGILRDVLPELSHTVDHDPLESSNVPSLERVVRLGEERTPGMTNFEEIPTLATDVHRARLAEIEPRLQFDDPINVQFTSGTTGAPKGATLTHHNILNNGLFVGRAMRLTASDRLCIPVPLYHCFGMVLGNLACITHGATMIYPSLSFEAEATLECLSQEKCTALHGVPTMFIAALNHPRFAEFDLGSLRTGIMAGSPCPSEVMKRVVRDMHAGEITIAYGMTETSPVSFQTSPQDPLDKRVGSVGRVHPHIEVKIIDSQGRVVQRGESGELCTRGYSVMTGYWGDSEATRAAVDGFGWMHSGDLATLDEQGYGRIVGRIKDMVIRGGENIYPREIEEFLYGHPRIEDVQVIGVPDEQFGEELCAWIRLRPSAPDQAPISEDSVRDYCRDQIAHYKIPKYVRFVESFPMTVTGKVQKYRMREIMQEELQRNKTGSQ